MWILGLKALKLRGWQKDKQNFVSFSFSWSILAFLTIGSFFTITVEILTCFIDQEPLS